MEKAVCVVLIGVGTMLMITRKETDKKEEKKEWLIYAVLSAVFASLTAILGKIGIEGVDSNLGTAIRTTVVLFMAWMMVAIKGKICADQKYRKERTGLYCRIRPCHRRVLDVLLQSS